MYKVIFRRDTLAQWQAVNPVLDEGETALVATDPEHPTIYNMCKRGDGVTRFNDLPMLGYDCLQMTGDSTLFPMSQKAVTDEFKKLEAQTVLIPEDEFNDLYDRGELDPTKTYHTY